MRVKWKRYFKAMKKKIVTSNLIVKYKSTIKSWVYGDNAQRLIDPTQYASEQG